MATVTEPPPVLKAIGVIRDDLDGICEAMRRVVTILDEHGQKMNVLATNMAQEDAVKEMMRSLPDKKAAALVVTFAKLFSLAPTGSVEETQNQFNMAMKQLDVLEKICAELHEILDGVV